MKKSFFILIFVVFLVSIVVVGQLGLAYRTFEDTIYTTGITCDTYFYNDQQYSFQKTAQGIIYAEIVFSNDPERPTTLVLDPKATPGNATILTEGGFLSFGGDEKGYPYVFTTTSAVATVDERGVVTFNRAGSATIRISPADNPTIFVEVKIMAR